jgi:hypothetical protein
MVSERYSIEVEIFFSMSDEDYVMPVILNHYPYYEYRVYSAWRYI